MGNPKETLFKALTDMRNTREDYPAIETNMKVDPEVYPYGLEIRLEENVLKKLDLKATDFEPQTEVRIKAVAMVKSINVSAGEYSHQCVTLQIQKMSLEE